MNARVRSCLAVCVAAVCVAAAPAAAVSTSVEAPGAARGKQPDDVPSFLDTTLAMIREYSRTVTTLTAAVTMKRQTAGLTQPVQTECRVEYHAPGMLEMVVKGIYPYTVSVSGGVVRTVFAASGDVDVRPLDEGERVLDDFLGIALLANQPEYDLRFSVEQDTYVVQASMRPEAQERLAQDMRRNARRAALRTLWVAAQNGRVTQTRVVTLSGDDTTLTFHEQWINTPAIGY